MTETSLTILALVFIALAGLRNSPAAVWFGLLTFSHSIFLGHLVDTDMMTYLATWGIFSVVSAAACYGFRKGDDDVIALRMMGISIFCLFTNIICIAVWLTGNSMEGFNYVFAGILIASIAVILKGDRDGLGTSTGSHMDSILRTNTNKHADFLVELENREAQK